MKRWLAGLLCVWLLTAGALSASADSTTPVVEGDVTQTEIITQTTIYYEEVEVEVLEKVRSPYPDGTAMACIVVGGVFILAAIALLCIYLFAFPRWGLVKMPETEETAEEGEVPDAVTEERVLSAETDDVKTDGGEETPSTVPLEDLF